MTNEEIKEKYTTVGELLEDAINKAESIELVGEEENAELVNINSTLKEINEEFKKEIAKLESSSEWEKLCIAFLGETNAGKSTIIESLRIIYDEEQRRLEKEERKIEYKLALEEHRVDYKDLLKNLQEVNELLVNKKEPSKFWNVIIKFGFILLGICIGFAISYIGA